MGQVAEPESGAAEVFEAAVEGFCGTIAGAGPVEEVQHIDRAAFQGVPQADQFSQLSGDAGGDASITLAMRWRPSVRSLQR